jgi:hypothetical protein
MCGRYVRCKFDVDGDLGRLLKLGLGLEVGEAAAQSVHSLTLQGFDSLMCDI